MMPRDGLRVPNLAGLGTHDEACPSVGTLGRRSEINKEIQS